MPRTNIGDEVRADEPRGWLRSLGRTEWAALGVTMLFWTFDGYETFALITTGPASLRDLLPASGLAHLSQYFAYLLAISLAGWTIGGVVGGFAGDRLGRRRTMIGAVVLYGLFTGLSALAQNWETLAVTRLLTGLGIGAEWAVGVSLLQEILPARARTKGAGLLQGTFSAGGLLVSLLWVLFNSSQTVSWRYIYLVGVLPAFLVIALRRAIPESRKWTAQRRASARELIQQLAAPVLRKRLGLALLVSVAITVGFWASSSYIPTYVGALAPGPRASFYTGWASALYNVGEIAGCVVFGFWAERWGRRLTTVGYFVAAVVIIPVVFLLVHDAGTAVLLQLVAGYAAGGIFSWYTVHTPELFPTAVRASAIGTIFNLTRVLASVGALVTGLLASVVGGVGNAAALSAVVYLLGIGAVLFLPETRGRPLPS
ncbi:MFS transporter [Amycolatopsis acidiphila]|uniref:MFS transporter n=1 Tax=Amycolatopsis acidiphila TaxID=715473 RepID=A0A558A6D3_9PSEU|nr:MFS transporter [Amycolatopsis acidiphila]TVT19829.1 MFS transporter [Amycolatopsis acidiphila]UIJ58733.1 MFS transporter [Amycolatopsis acidiphila]GHG71639.1 MFS transporter [Amycolatopsis acidiphila]